MAITYTGARQNYTDNTSVPWDNKPQASLAFFYRYEPAGGTGSGSLNTNYWINRGLAPYYAYTQASGIAGTLLCRFFVGTAAAQASRQETFNVGTTYHIAITFDQGHQVIWINGIADQFATLTGNTKTAGTNPVVFGASPVAGGPFSFTLDNFAMWNDYVLSAADVVGLRDGTLLPSAIGGSATWRGWWTMSGTPGANVTLGDPGIANNFGDAAYDLKHFAGAGTSIYSAPLVFEPQAATTPKVMTSGETIGFPFTAISNGAPTAPSAILTAPTVKVNGTPVGTLGNAWVTGSHPMALMTMPGGVVAGPGDAVTLSAPVGWANTPVGITGAMVDAPVTNCVGRSAYGTDVLTKTFKPGWNNAHLGSQWGGVYTITKNWRFRCGDFSAGTTTDANGRPTSSASFTTIRSTFFQMTPQTTVDSTIAMPVGLWAIGWDDTNPASPTTLGLVTNSALMVSITERTDLNNAGTLIGGVQVGIVRVFQVTQLATTPQDAGSNANANLILTITNALKTFSYANDVIYCPNDFTSGTPTVLDRSDPYALSNAYLSWLANGVGSLRWIDSLFGFGGGGSECETDQVFRLTDYTWGLWQGKVNRDAFFTSARPWDPGVTPYLYTSLFGSEYDCTLGGDINSSVTALTISDAATAVIVAGQRLRAGTELMRVQSVSGTTVNVTRGTCGTTAASHTAGTLKVQYRWDASGTNIPSGQMIELVSATPHLVEAAQTLKAFGSWPSMTFTDATHPPSGSTITNYSFPSVPTGPNTLLLLLPGSQSPWVTLDGTYTLDGASCKLAGKWPSAPAIPIEFAAKVAARFDNCALHFSLPHACSDSLAHAGWRWVRDNLPAGRKVWFEYSNEPWNFIFVEYQVFQQYSAWLYPGTSHGWEYYVRRMTELLTIGRNVWTAAGRDPNDIQGLINRQKGDTSSTALMLEFARGLGVPIGGVAIADYTHVGTATSTLAAYWQYNDNQASDLVTADLRTDPVNGYTAVFNSMLATINAYNAAHGGSTKLYIYEGGASAQAPVVASTLSGAIDASTTSVTVASSAGMLVAGTPLLCESEWMTVVSVAGNVLTVTRGAYGSTAATHTSGRAIRTAWIERSHDLLYNPNQYFYDQELYAMEQAAGIAAANHYSLAIGSADANNYYGAYHNQLQTPGKGDGSDGKFDNRTLLCTPGKPASKGATVNQDMVAVSPRGQAFLDWMGGMGSFAKVRLPFIPYRRRR
jgi:hypothetical protein